MLIMSYFYDSVTIIPIFSWVGNKAKIREGNTMCGVDGYEPFPSLALPTLGVMLAPLHLCSGDSTTVPVAPQRCSGPPTALPLPFCAWQKSRLLCFVSAPRRGVGTAGGGRHTRTDLYGYKYGDVKYMHPQARANTEGDF